MTSFSPGWLLGWVVNVGSLWWGTSCRRGVWCSPLKCSVHREGRKHWGGQGYHYDCPQEVLAGKETQ